MAQQQHQPTTKAQPPSAMDGMCASVVTVESAITQNSDVDIAELTQAAVEDAETRRKAREDMPQRERAATDIVVPGPHLDVGDRPEGITKAVRFKFDDARKHSGWEMDSADNYTFGSMAGIHVVEALCARTGRVRVLDAGAGFHPPCVVYSTLDGIEVVAARCNDCTIVTV